MNITAYTEPPLLRGIDNPEIASAPRWPIVLYFHHVCPQASNYTEITPCNLAYGLDLLMMHFVPLDLKFLESLDQSNLTRCPSFVITFDDGYLDNLQWAVPFLEARGLHAVFFVVTNEVESGLAEKQRMSWDDLKTLANRGHLIGSHSLTHRSFRSVPMVDVEVEISESLRIISVETGVKSRLVAYPYGDAPLRAPADPNLIGFGTVKAPALPWSQHRLNIRRTYLPFGYQSSWGHFVERWRAQWESGP